MLKIRLCSSEITKRKTRLLALRLFQANLKSRKWETWRSNGVGNVFWTETFLIRRRKKKETVEAWRRSPMGMNKTNAEHGEGRSWGKPMVPFAHTHTGMGSRKKPKETGPQGTDPWPLAWKPWGHITNPDTTKTPLILRKGLSSASLAGAMVAH